MSLKSLLEATNPGIAENQCTPGLSICYAITTSIIAALKVLRQKQASSYVVPTILQLRSVSSNPTLGPNEFVVARSIL